MYQPHYALLEVRSDRLLLDSATWLHTQNTTSFYWANPPYKPPPLISRIQRVLVCPVRMLGIRYDLRLRIKWTNPGLHGK